MSKSVKTADLQVGMKVSDDILGKRGDIKVGKDEILSQVQIDAMKSWKGLDEANPKGIQVESSPLHSGAEVSRIVDHPWESPLIEKAAKEKVSSTMVVDVAFDKDGNIIRDDKDKVKDGKTTGNVSEKKVVLKSKGKPKKNRT